MKQKLVLGIILLFTELTFSFLVQPSSSDNHWSAWQVTSSINTTCTLVRIRNTCTGEYLCNNGREWDNRLCTDPSIFEPWSPWECQRQLLATDCLLLRRRNCATDFLHICDNIIGQKLQTEKWTDLRSCPCINVTTDISNSYNVTTWSGWNEWECRNLTAHCFFYRTRDKCSSSDIQNCRSTDSVQLVSLENANSCPCTQDNRWSAWQLTSSINTTCAVVRLRDNCTGEYLCNNGREWDYRQCTDPSIFEAWSPWECQPKMQATDCLLQRSRNCATEFLHICDNITGQRLQIDRWTDLRSCPCYNVTTALTSKSTTVSAKSSMISTFQQQPTTVKPTSTNWGAWGKWLCTQHGGNCSMTRTRKCIDIVCEHNEEKESQDCTDDVCHAHWKTWSNWLCHTVDGGICLMLRRRNCSSGNFVDCGESQDATELVPCARSICPELLSQQLSGKCGAYKESEYICKDLSRSCASLNATQDACNNPEVASKICPRSCGCCDNEMEGIPQWEIWSPWQCKLEPVSQCVMVRTRRCSSGKTTDCTGEADNKAKCTIDVCPEMYDIKVDCSYANVHNCDERHSNCAPFTVSPSLQSRFCSMPESVRLCPSTCGCCFVSPSSTITVINITASPTYTTLLYTNKTTPAATSASASTTFSSTYPPTAAVVSPSATGTATASVPKWRYWYCKTVDNGRCVMYQKNACHPEVSPDCDQAKTNINEQPCDPNICPDHYAIENNGKCYGYTDSRSGCSDTAITCNYLTEENQACFNPDVATVCPRTCGCCDNERKGIVLWEAWSQWRCALLLAPYPRCQMARNRSCSSENMTDCLGEHQEKDDCKQELCHVPIHVRVDCSTVDKCEDNPICQSLSYNLEYLCSGGYLAANCPLVCGCCCNSTSCTSKPQTTLLSSAASNQGTNTLKTTSLTTSSNTAVPISSLLSKSSAMTTTYQSLTISTTSTSATKSTPGVSGQWSDWFSGRCTATCGPGTMPRFRHCSTGHDEDCAGQPFESVSCNVQECPKIAVWLEWSDGTCSKTCGDGQVQRSRHCSTGLDEDCPGAATETQSCKLTECLDRITQ